MTTTFLSSDSTVSFRPYGGDADFPSLVAFVAMQYEHEREFQKLARKHGGVVAPSYAADLLKAVADRKGCLVLAEAGGVPVGFVAAYCMQDPDPILEESARNYAYVRDLFVLPNWRRMKIALRLLGEAEKHFRTTGVFQLRLGGPAQSVAMMSLCKSHDFEAHHIVYSRVIQALPSARSLHNSEEGGV